MKLLGAAITVAESDEDLLAVLRLREQLDPTARPLLENFKHGIVAMQGQYLLARLDGEPVACGMSTVFPGMDAVPFLPAHAAVLPKFRRRGIGESLLRACSARARELGKEGLETAVRSDEPDGIRFLEHRSFREMEREEEVELDLATLAGPPAVDPPTGIEIVSCAERPGHEREMYEVDQEVSADIPGLVSMHESTFEEWRAFAIERPSRALDLTFLAIADGRCVGVALMELAGDRCFNNLTGVLREWRGKGVASALKRAQIAVAMAKGVQRIVTESHSLNVPMRTLNEKLGYRPTVANIVYRGPLLPERL